MNKSELRKARQAAHAAGIPLTGELQIGNQAPKPIVVKRVRRVRNQYASREEQHARYIDCGPSAWDDRD